LIDAFTRTLNEIRRCTRSVLICNQQEIVMNKLVVTLASLCAFGAFTTSRADVADSAPRSVIVHFGDLDPRSLSGAAALYARLHAAAEMVCRDFEPGRALALQRPYRSCLRFAMGNAVTAVDRPVLTAYASARGMAPQPIAPRVAQSLPAYNISMHVIN
jgi:UrcA family protein